LGSQLNLNLGHRLTLNREDYYVSSANSLAIRALDDWTIRTEPGFIIVGPKSSGKTHLASVWRKETGAESLNINQFSSLDVESLVREKFLVIENLNCLTSLNENEKNIIEEKILHVFNFFAGSGGKILITATNPPGNWNIQLADLLSRLMALQIAELSLPDDNLLAAVMSKQFADRQILVSPQVIGHAMVRMERSFWFADKLVKALDSESMSIKKPISKKLVIRVINKLVSSGSKA
jgi:chromosomal replication initiation ATPase DnaA